MQLADHQVIASIPAGDEGRRDEPGTPPNGAA
ncbi:hypothetical protein BH24ACT6_BH24ACT6_04380 [soil metagenome]